ncbi:TetR/AcrR family transcriptional regulator [Parafrankia elaeagni]|uniref:TetR/AcrR family transcriptional regulator n=1 Tax=Parafrankia elaeagni TaxID=222534 RepID=UPI000363CB6E|nr:TetR/AcrR family transcriptional regulator [Parafrankia elaeagni]
MADQSARRVGRPPSTVDGRTVPERLLGVALRLFAEKGFEGTSVQDVVAAAGVTKGAMYHYFGSKDDLLYEIYGRVLRMQTARLEKAAAQEGPIGERVHAAAADVVVTTIENLESATIFFRSLHQLNEEKRKEVRRERRRYHQIFRAMIEEGQACGAFRDDLDADLIVDYFFGSVHHLPMWWKPRGRLSEREIGRSFADLLLAGLTPR